MAVPAALLVLAGCSEPQAANDTLPTAAPTSATPTLEPLGPADFPVPDEAREQTEAGAEAMAVYYLDLLDQTKSRVGGGGLDVAALQSLSNACETCDQVTDGFVNADRMGYRYEGGDLQDPSFGSVTVSDNSADIAFTVRQASARVIGSDGSEVRSSPEMLLRGGIVLRWDSVRDGWIATQLNLTN
ncbi:hypothetical protein [Klenkia sp. PcliD-1-E]|uniref:hypothetical protein n=1 Tax=Klenkia sp. PcliD-1-E TaxID=2954492 RepID=UPI002096897F|nr:hypothetical protein [Klenkia sp. PcliD-1-E]MCO7218517.1 hypothetical protein [Klenkia sp. PcliD-1-E]